MLLVCIMGGWFVAIMESAGWFIMGGWPLVFMLSGAVLLVAVPFMEGELATPMLFEAMLPICGGAIVFMALVCIIWGALVVIMEPDGWFIMGEESWAFMARGNAQARKTNDSLRSLMCFFIWFSFLFLCWLVCGGNKMKRQPAAGGLQRLKLAVVCHPNG